LPPLKALFIFVLAQELQPEAEGPKENSDVDSSAETDQLPGRFLVEKVMATARRKSRKLNVITHHDLRLSLE
jgi:hypothetical protein